MRPHSVKRANEEGYEIDDDRARLDLDAVHGYLKTSYWSPGIPRETVVRAVASSWCFGLYGPDGPQIGFARLVTDYATFAYLADVYIDEALRGRGLSKWLMATIFSLPELAGLRRILLATRDAHGLYGKYGFGPLGRPESFMEINRPTIYSESEPRS